MNQLNLTMAPEQPANAIADFDHFQITRMAPG
jgi:hypothetical protein